MKQNTKDKILIIIGPTSSGKSELAVQLAKKFNGEIISCDSRQIYHGMNLGTGKVTGKWIFYKFPGREICRRFVYKKIIHHCIDYVNPKKQYSVDQFKNDAQQAIIDIISRGKLPILCGGTMHWIDALVYNQHIPEVPPNLRLRKKLEKFSHFELYEKLKMLDPDRAISIDKNNPRRLIRALEIVLTTGKPVPIFKSLNVESLNYSPLWIGIKTNQEQLYKKIDSRLKQRLKQGLIKEVQNLHLNLKSKILNQKSKRGLSWKRLESFGLEYRFVSQFLQKKISYEEMFKELSFAIKHYSKRQLTWWKRNKDINWVENYHSAEKLIKNFV